MRTQRQKFLSQMCNLGLNNLYNNLRVRLGSREEALVSDLLSRGSHLVVLKLHTVCTDQMLKTVSQTCLCLAGLDVSFARNVTDSGIEMLCR